MEIMLNNIWNWIKPIISTPQGIIFILSLGVAYYMYKSANQDTVAKDKLKAAVNGISDIVRDSKKEIGDANEKLKDNIELAETNLKEVVLANEQLLATNEKLSQASLQLEKNYQKTVDALNKSIEAKEEAMKSKNEIIGKLMGGESYPELTLKKGGFYLTARGKYNIPNLKIAIILIEDCLNIPKDVTLNYLLKKELNRKYFKLIFNGELDLRSGVINPINIENFKNNLPTENGKTHAFEVIFETKLKKWIQRIRITSFKGRWEIANILDEVHGSEENSHGGEKEILKQVSEGYPAVVEFDHIKNILFFNSSMTKPETGYPVPIEYNNKNGISGRSFDDL